MSLADELRRFAAVGEELEPGPTEQRPYHQHRICLGVELVQVQARRAAPAAARGPRDAD
jgi:hypothetical protein